MSESTTVDDDARLKESEERYRAVIQNASDMIQSVRPDGTFEFVNRAWLDKLGYTEDEVNDLIVWDVIHPDSTEHCMPIFMKAVQGETIDSMETAFKTKDGQKIPVEGSVTSRFLGDTVVATHGFFRDISERLRAQELEQRNRELEREQQARYLEKMAALGKLSAGLAHELNNPAAAVQRAASRLSESLSKRDEVMRQLAGLGCRAEQWQAIDQLIMECRTSDFDPTALDPLQVSEQETGVEDWLDDHAVEQAWDIAPSLVQVGITEERLERLAAQLTVPELSPFIRLLTETLTIDELTDVISRGSHRMSELVQAVKGYSYMDRGTEQVVDIHDGLESTLIILGHQLRDVTVHRDYDRSLPPVRAFGNTLNQVWTNILDNAVDATGGKGTISMRTRRENGNAVVELEDNGSGIAPEDLSCIFEPFFTTKPQGQGTGLGLDTVWRIVTEEHGGTIRVESAPGRTVFRVAIPLAETQSEAATG